MTTSPRAVLQPARPEDYPYEFGTVDRTDWLSGPWDGEVDYLAWEDPETRYSCAIIRSGWSGHLCGYVQVPESHRLRGVGHNEPQVQVPAGWMNRKVNVAQDIGYLNLLCAAVKSSEDWSLASLDLLLYCHGGLTYGSGNGNGWLGFDCAHAGDLSPGLTRENLKHSWHKDDVYRDISFVRAECSRLARQIWEYENLGVFPQAQPSAQTD